MSRTSVRFVRTIATVAALGIATIPVARAVEQTPYFKGRCVAHDTSHLEQSSLKSSLNWNLGSELQMYAAIPVLCTGILHGKSVANRTMSMFLLGGPGVINCVGTSNSPHGQIELVRPSTGGHSIFNRGLMQVDNVKRKISFSGLRLPSLQNLTLGTIKGSFTFSQPTTKACETGADVYDSNVHGSITFG
jgi:hypothetical protein